MSRQTISFKLSSSLDLTKIWIKGPSIYFSEQSHQASFSKFPAGKNHNHSYASRSSVSFAIKSPFKNPQTSSAVINVEGDKGLLLVVGVIERQRNSPVAEHLVKCTLGLSPLPCLRNVPVINQKLLLTLNWFSTMSLSPRHGCGLFHSYGLNRAITKRVKLTSMYAASTYSQISTASGFMKENNRVGWLEGT